MSDHLERSSRLETREGWASIRFLPVSLDEADPAVRILSWQYRIWSVGHGVQVVMQGGNAYTRAKRVSLCKVLYVGVDGVCKGMWYCQILRDGGPSIDGEGIPTADVAMLGQSVRALLPSPCPRWTVV